MATLSELLCTKEAAHVLNMSPRTLDNRRWKGLPPAFRKFGSSVRYHIRDLEEFIESSKKNNSNE